MKFFSLRMALVFLVLCTTCRAVSAAVKLDLLTSNMPYFSEVDPRNPHGDPAGFSIMLAKAIARETDTELDIHSVPWARLIRDVHEDSHIMATGVVRTPERENQFYWITPITYNPIGLYGKPRSVESNVWQNIDSVSVLRGDYREDIVRLHKLRQILSTNTWEQAVKAVLKGRVDAVFYSGVGLQITCQTEGLVCEKITLLHMERTAVAYIAMSKKPENAEIAEKLQKAALRVKQSPEFNGNAMKWMKANSFLQNHSSYASGAIVFNGALQ